MIIAEIKMASSNRWQINPFCWAVKRKSIAFSALTDDFSFGDNVLPYQFLWDYNIF